MKLSILLSAVFTSLLFVGATVSQTQTASLEYDPWMDYNDDGIIDIFDIVDIASRYRTTGTPYNKSLFQRSLRFLEQEGNVLTVPASATLTPWINCSEAWTWTPNYPDNAVLYTYWWLEYMCNVTDPPWETYFTLALVVNGQMQEHTVWNTGFGANGTRVLQGTGVLPNQPNYTFQFGIQGYSAQTPYEVTVSNLHLVVGIVDGW